MAIFHSYVKLPEGNIHWKFINYSSCGAFVASCLPRGFLWWSPCGGKALTPSCTMTCHWADPMGGDGSPWGDPSGVFSPFPAHPSVERCWKYLLIFIASLGLELLTEDILTKSERQDPSGISGFLLISPYLFWWINPPNLHGPSEASHLRSAQAGHVLLPFERAAHQSLRGGPAIRDDPPNRNLRMPKRNWLGMILIYIYIYIYMYVCVFSYDMIKWSIHLYYDESSKLSSQRIVHVFPCFSASLEAISGQIGQVTSL